MGNILVAERGGVVRECMRDRTWNRKFSAEFACNGKDALTMASNGDFDLILLDNDMPGLSGFDFVSMLKSAEVTKNTPVAMILSSEEDKNHGGGFEASVVDYLVKPFSSADLTCFLEKLFNDQENSTSDRFRIMAVEDSPIVGKVYAQLLSKHDFEYKIVCDSTKAIEAAKKFCPDLILMDQNMPDINGFELTSMMKADKELEDIRIIMVTSDTKKKSVVRALEHGAVDFLTKPFDEETLLARMGVHLNNKKLFDQLEQAYKEMEVLKNKLELLSITDGLTGLYNHRHFHNALEREMQTARKNHDPLSVILFDIDHFKKFNDTYGHKVGDKVIHSIAETLEKSVRERDITARYGGEEYTVALPGASADQAGEVAETIRANVENTKVETEGQLLSVTISVGVAEWDLRCGIDRFVGIADCAMYQSKKNGRNRVTIA